MIVLHAFSARRVCLGLVLLALAACSPPPAPPQPLTAVLVFTAQGSRAGSGGSYTGELRPRYESQLGFRVQGKIVARLVEVGERVHRGQVLARLDPADTQLSAQSAQAQSSAAQADFMQAKADLSRYADLRDKHFISDTEFDRHRNTFAVAEARLQQARAQSDLARNQAQYTTLLADADGVITAVQAEAGQVVSSGQVVLRLARLGEVELAINLPETQVVALRAGAPAQVSLWSRPDLHFAGRVREIAPVADAVTHTYGVRVSLLNPGPEAQLGMTAAAVLGGATDGQVVRVPMTSLYQTGREPAVWLVDAKTQTLQLRPVTVRDYGQDLASLASGVTPGELVVRAGVHKLHAGEKVRVLQETAP